MTPMTNAIATDFSSTGFIRRVLHPSDLSEESMAAFAHALKAALAAKGKLILMHVTNDGAQEWTEFPGVRETLERWKLLPAGSRRQAVLDLGIEVNKVIARGPNPTAGVLHYIEEKGADLVVLATHHRAADWLQRSVAEPVARKSGAMTLFVPTAARNFVSLDDGSISLRNVLIPIADTPAPNAAIAGAARLVQQLGCEAGRFILLHVGDDAPGVATPDVPGWVWQKLTKSGNVIDAILETAQTVGADLIVMATDGRDGVLDAFRGSHSERVLRQAPCPLLAIPESSYVGQTIADEMSATSRP
jgi:nucleotide-binding universal stress UspA family protein